MKTFIDNVAVQCVESKLASKLENILSPSRIIQMDASQIGRIAAESIQSQDRRERVSRKLTILEAGAEVCKRFVGQSSMGMFRTPHRLRLRLIISDTLQHHQWPVDGVEYLETEEDDSSIADVDEVCRRTLARNKITEIMQDDEIETDSASPQFETWACPTGSVDGVQYKDVQQAVAKVPDKPKKKKKKKKKS